MTKLFGIDISTWQKNYPYAGATKEGVKFAIIRAGYRKAKDGQFETHYKNAKAQGWGVGAYWYTYATTVADAKEEAKAFLNAIAGKKFDYPVYLDLEDSSVANNTSKETRDAIVRAFGEIMENAGYYFGVYTNKYWYSSVISGSELNKKYDWWIAQWSTNEPTGVNYGIWQFGGGTNYQRSNKIAGVVTDQNWAIKDYPTIIKDAGLNGFSKDEPTKTIDELAREVIDGKWGNGQDRVNKLTEAGYDYNAVQKRVNEILEEERKPKKLEIGTKVKVIKTGKASSDGSGKTATDNIEGTITRIITNAKYPYLISNKYPIGWYQEDALQIL